MRDVAERSTRELFEDHLRLAGAGDLESVLARDVAEDVVVLCGRGTFWGRDGVRELARQLADEVPNGRWNYVTQLVEGRLANLEWTVDEGPVRVRDGADSFLVEDGKIRAQTIHYTVEDEHGTVLVRADGRRPG